MKLAQIKPIREKHAKELEKFADMIGRAVINFQENDWTVLTIIVQKLLKKFLS